MTRHATKTTAAALLAALLASCSDREAVIGSPGGDQPGQVTLTSDDSTARVSALCVSDIPRDLTTCPGAPANLGQVELDETRKATLVVPQEVATGGYRVRVNGQPLPGSTDVLNDLNQQLRIPVPLVEAPGETVVTVEALFSREHPRAVWQFLLSDPPGTAD